MLLKFRFAFHLKISVYFCIFTQDTRHTCKISEILGGARAGCAPPLDPLVNIDLSPFALNYS